MSGAAGQDRSFGLHQVADAGVGVIIYSFTLHSGRNRVTRARTEFLPLSVPGLLVRVEDRSMPSVSQSNGQSPGRPPSFPSLGPAMLA